VDSTTISTALMQINHSFSQLRLALVVMLSMSYPARLIELVLNSLIPAQFLASVVLLSNPRSIRQWSLNCKEKTFQYARVRMSV